MHVSSITSALPLDPNPNWHWNWLLHFVFTAVVLILGFLHLLRSTTSKYFVVDNNFHSSSSSSSSVRMASPSSSSNDSCAVCSNPTSKQCSRCKAVKYCSQTCQSEHWKSEHKRKCKELQLLGTAKPLQRVGGGKRSFSVSLVPSSGPNKIKKLVEQVLFPYDEFVKLFNWDKPIFPPCGLLNCGNSCFANVVLQCLAHTRPLLAYLLDKGHRRDCRRNEWCFLCELQTHMERASRGQQPFSPINILSRLPSIGGNLGYGKQEDAHEFMRFAIDTMQSVCLDEHGGEEVIHPKSQETTLIQHIFGGQLQSQVICAHCSQVSNQYENMMDLTVEIQGDATSLEDCLDQFTRKEWLHGDNMYKCDGCNDYVSAWKRLTIHQAPNILTIALKRFQSGRFGKINKKITFPESLDLSPYVSEGRDGSDKYKLYAVVVHVDMLNASFFGHYICYTKGFQGNWYRIDDCKVMSVELDEVLSQGAYMLLYSRVSARPTSLQTPESASKQQQEEDKMASGVQVADNCPVLLANPSKSNFSEGSSATACQSSEQQSKRVSIDGVEESHTVNSVSSLPVSVKVLDNGDDSLSALTEEIHCGPRVVLSYPTSSREQSSSIVPDSSEPSSLCVNAASDTTYDASSSASVSLEETNGQITVNGYPDPKGNCVEPRTDGEPYVAGSADNNAGDVRDRKVVPLIDENAPCEVSCNGNGNGSVDLNFQINGNRNDPKMCHVSFSKEECEVLPDHMGLDPVELRQSVDISESAVDGTVMRDAPPEKSCVQGKRSCISNSSSELD